MSAVQDALAKLRKEGHNFGVPEKDQEFWSTGNLLIDEATSGGIPKGRAVEIYGLPSSGKTTLALQTAVSVQESGRSVLFLDFERSFDKKYARSLGLDIDAESFIYFQPKSLEDGGDILRSLLDTGELGLVIVDSVARMTTRKELDAPTGTITVADRAKMLTQLNRQILNQMADNDTTVIWLNHILDVIETGFMAGKGPKQTTTPGGQSIKYYASMRLHCKQKNPVKTLDGSDPLENDIEIIVTKNKVGVPFRKVTVRNVFGEGLSQKVAVIDLLISSGAIAEGKQKWYTMADVRILVASLASGEKKWRRGDIEDLYDTDAAFRGTCISMARDLVLGAVLEDTTKRDEEGDEIE